jgi:regulator of RNase E activity RraA
MQQINPMPAQIDPKIVEMLLKCRTETIGHHRHWGMVHGSIRQIVPGSRVAGTAVTVAAPGHDSSMVPYAIGMLRPGDVLVIDRLGDNHNACWGGGTTLAAKTFGAAAVVIDGPSTGSSKFEEYGLPAWIRGYSPVTAHQYGNGGAINIPVSVGGAVVLPGDAILADECGVIVLRADEAEYLARMALDRQSKGAETLALIRSGIKPADRLGISEKIEKGVAAEAELRRKYSGA